MPEDKNLKPNTDEIATTSKDIDIFQGYFGRLENPDPTLRTESNGKGLRLYDEVDRDPHAGSVLQTRYLAVVGKEWEVLPGDDSSKNVEIAKFVKKTLTKTNFNQFRQELLQGILYGFYEAEVMWGVDNQAIVPTKLLAKHPRRFCFNLDREVRLLTLENMITGEPVPDRKFITFTYGSSDNPYGKGLGQRLWWPVWFKKHGIKFWLIFLEKFGMPTGVGKYPPGTDPEKQQELLNAIDAIQTETGVKIPNTMAIELLEATRSGKATYESLCDYMDRQISKAVLGQTLTTEIKGGGSYAASQTHNDVRHDILKADADLLSECLNNTLVRWLVDYNFANVAEYPKTWIRTDEEKDLKPLAERDKIIMVDMGMGKRIPESYITETYGIPLAEEGEAVIDAGVDSEPKPLPGEGDFAEGNRETRDQKTIDVLVTGAVGKAIPIFNTQLKTIKDFLASAKSLKKAGDRIVDLYPDMDPKPLAKLLAGSLQAADRMGSKGMESDFVETLWGPGTPFDEAVDYFKTRSFTLANVNNADLIASVKGEIEKALTDGMTLKDFRTSMDSMYERHGYTQLAPYRIETIFRTNMQSAYQGGRYRQMTSPAVLAARPYWRYVAVMDAATRPEHVALHGKIFRFDHPFWGKWYPPNGYRCRCTVTTTTEKQMAREGWESEDEDPTGKLFEPIDPETGNKMPARSLLPDAGWDHNPAAESWTPDLDQYEPALKKYLKAAIGDGLEALSS